MAMDVKEFKWPMKALVGDYVRGSLGALFALLCATLAPAGSWWQIVLFVLLIVFLTFLCDVMIRNGTRVAMSSAALSSVRPIWGETRIEWACIDGLDVRFYPSRRDRTAGWMTAKIKGQSRTISLDDALPGFEDVMERAMQALEARGLGMNESTAANLASLGLGLRPRVSK
jgi:hypothetical protein